MFVELAVLTWFYFFCVCVGFSLDYKDEAVDSLLSLKDQLENPDHSVLYKTCSDLTKVHFVPLSKAVLQFNIARIESFVSLPR